jgi:hypothetical protein
MENIPGQPQNPTLANRHSAVGDVEHKAPRGRRISKFHKVLILVGAVILVALLAFGGFFLYQSRTGSNIDGGKYQAVFLSNGQVYFGKLSPLNSEYMKLNDIFYLQTKADTTSGNPQATSSQTASDVQLIKLGNEIHGPDDQMTISKSQILFFENLKKDSKVSSSIDSYQKK